MWPLGDSLTVGGYGDPVNFTDSYRYELYRQLRAGGADVVFRGHIGLFGAFGFGAVPPAGTSGEFSHSGVGGYTAGDMLREINTFFPGVRPDVIVLNLGTNASRADDYRALVSRLQVLAPNAYIVLGTLPPRVPELGSRQIIDSGRLATNALIRSIGNASSVDRIFTADVTDRMLNQQAMSNADFFDDTHLSVSGGTKFGRALQPEVAQAVSLAKRC